MSNKYKVTIRATVTKTYEIEDAEDVDEATERAHILFSVMPEDDIDEDYEQETVSVTQVVETDTLI